MQDNVAQDFGNKTFSVTELTAVIKDLLEGSFPRITLEGEISNCRPASTGHLYFTLKDSSATISAVMFKGKTQYLNFSPCDGTLVQVRGTVSVYPPRGTYQIIVDSMELAGTGNILQMLEERKRRLASEGLFDSQKKKRLPFFPKTIGVVTSPTGAALRDILQIASRRNPKVSVLVLPCAVQGAEAAPGIAKMIQIANAYKMADVLIIGRGGGSLEDLLPFSEECVVRAVAASKIPTVSAVGHEIDFSLSDFAADVRAPTPSAAAEIVTPLLVDIKDAISSSKGVLYEGINVKLEKLRLLVRSFTPDSMELRFRSIEQPLLMRFDTAKEVLLQAMEQKCKETRQRIENVVRDLDGANPKNILARGYSMVKDLETGKIVRSEKDTAPGHLIEITPASGKIIAKTEGV